MKLTGNDYFIGVNGKLYNLSMLPSYTNLEKRCHHKLQQLDAFLGAFSDENELRIYLISEGIHLIDGEIKIYEKIGDNAKEVSRVLYADESFLLEESKVRRLSNYCFVHEPAYNALVLEKTEATKYEDEQTLAEARIAMKKFLVYIENKRFYKQRVGEYESRQRMAKRSLEKLQTCKLSVQKGDNYEPSYRSLHDFVIFNLDIIDEIEYLRYCASQYVILNNQEYYASHGYKKNFRFSSKMTYEQKLTVTNPRALRALKIPRNKEDYQGQYINLDNIFKNRKKSPLPKTDEIDEIFKSDLGEQLDFEYYADREEFRMPNLEEKYAFDSLSDSLTFTRDFNLEHDTYYTPEELRELFEQTYKKEKGLTKE